MELEFNEKYRRVIDILMNSGYQPSALFEPNWVDMKGGFVEDWSVFAVSTTFCASSLAFLCTYFFFTYSQQVLSTF